MKIDLDKYNKRLLAIIGTTVIVITVGSVLIGAIAFAVDQISRANRHDQSDVMTIEQDDDTTVVTNQPVIRKYEISMSNLELIDSASATYIIPIGHIKLETSELIDGETTNFGSGSSRGYGSKKFSGGSGSGFFNNMIIYKGKEEVSHVVFKSKTVIMSYFTIWINNELLIVFQGVSKDSNGDKGLTNSDFNSLFVYHVESKVIDEVRIEGASINSSTFLRDLSKIMITCTKDKNDNGEWEHDEPKVLYTYDFNTKNLSPAVSPKNTSAMQKMLDK
jgi:hypothetical protein